MFLEVISNQSIKLINLSGCSSISHTGDKLIAYSGQGKEILFSCSSEKGYEAMKLISQAVSDGKKFLSINTKDYK